MNTPIFCDLVNDWIDVDTCTDLCNSLGNKQAEDCEKCYEIVLS
ncbi:MAG: hypothetical protein ACTSVE_04360 [Candidatus Helarchaeota archaeon]